MNIKTLRHRHGSRPDRRRECGKFLALVALVSGLVMIAALAGGASTLKSAPPGSAVARLQDASGNRLGSVWFLPRASGKLAIRVSVSFLSEGFHGFHVHSVGKCDPPFTTAGGHFNPGGAGHGSHAGDLSPLWVDRDGRGWLELQTDRFAVADLLDADGSAIVVHAGADNLAHIPARYSVGGPDAATLATGDAGSRLACGVVQRP